MERGPAKEACAATLFMFVYQCSPIRQGKMPTQEKLVFLLFIIYLLYKMQQAAGRTPVLTPSGSPLKYARAPAQSSAMQLLPLIFDGCGEGLRRQRDGCTSAGSGCRLSRAAHLPP
jgi:hypothetical protein